MIQSSSNIQTVWAELLVEELVRNGVTCFCMSSGARCGPITSAVARHANIEPVVHVDERASAFYALGHARATRTPAVWITTSGTAVANGLPAVMEAAQDHVPLILLTADRPPELRDTGANQTTDQVKVFQPYVRWQVDLPCSDTAITPSFVLTTVDQAVARATEREPGPVHMNAMLREPLTPTPDGHDYSDYLAGLADWLESDRPFTSRGEYLRTPTPQTMDTVAAMIGKAENGLLVVGRLTDDEERRAARELARMLPWPVFADITSSLRLGKQQTDHIIAFADQALLADRTSRKPDLLVHLGGPVVSKRINAYVAQHAQEAHLVQIKSNGNRQDPAHRVRYALEVHFPTFMTALRARNAKPRPARTLKPWQDDSATVAKLIDSFLSEDAALDEIYVASEISRAIPDTHGLFMAASMPIRDMDMYGLPGGASAPVAANRGVSGIDGTIASACGWANGLGRPVIVVAGDLACLHDLNALNYVRNSKQPVIVVVVNNDGGGIFSFLPLAEQQDVFETCFGTPHGLTFEHAARQFQLPYARPETRVDFRVALAKALELGRSCVIEVQTVRDANVTVHCDLQSRIRDALKER